MDFREVIKAMAGGNVGALTACCDLMEKGDQIDPGLVGAGFRALSVLDSLGIYESRIYVFWNYVTKRDLGKTIAVLRAYELGELAGVNAETLNRSIAERRAYFDLDVVVEAVKKELPDFNPDAVPA